jgi:hypothetical protein
LIAQNQSLSDQLADIRSDIAKARKSTQEARIYVEARAFAEGQLNPTTGEPHLHGKAVEIGFVGMNH